MSRKEFCEMIAPSVMELQTECGKMTEKEFMDFKKDVLLELENQRKPLVFMTAVIDMIYGNLFQKVG